MYIRNPETNVWEEVFLPPTGDTYPIGMYGYFAGNNAPTNWLRCDGQEVSRTDYAELFNTIGTTYGSGDGATTFNLPNVNLENRTLVGSSGDGEFSLGNTGGEKEHALTINEMPTHSHNMNGVRQWKSGGTKAFPQDSSIISAVEDGLTSNEGGSQAHNNMQPFMASVCCIKAKQSVGVVGTVTSDINDTNDNAVPNAKTVKDYVEEVYSTDEVKTNKVWIDGKPIYRKTIAFNYTTNSINAIPLNINNYNEIWLDLSASFIKYDGTRVVPIVRADYRNIQYSIGVIIDIANKTVSLQTGENIPSGNGYVTVLYTKTTSEA